MHLSSFKCMIVISIVLSGLFMAGSVGAMEIYVVTSTAKTVAVQVDTEDTIADVKNFVYNVTNLHAANQIMKKDNKVLDNKQTLASYNISDGDTLYVIEGVDPSVDLSKKKSGPGFYFYLIIGVVVVIYLLTRHKPDTKHHPR